MLNRDDLPPSAWAHRYQVGFVVLEWGDNPLIFWRTISREKFLARYYRFVIPRSHPEDILAVFHVGDVQRFGRTIFRALRA
ncbi:MAG: hypothetical protein ACREUY_03875 [Burkholderiales bacterium]